MGVVLGLCPGLCQGVVSDRGVVLVVFSVAIKIVANNDAAANILGEAT